MIDAIAKHLLLSLSLEELLESPLGFALALSPVQRAVCRVATGQALGALLDDAAVVGALGGREAAEGVVSVPKMLAVVSGIRGGKSLLVAGCAVYSALHADLEGLGPGEVARFPIVSLTTDIAKVIYSHVRGRVEASPLLRRLVHGEPTSKTITLRRPQDGKLVEIVVSAGARAGGSLVGRWLVGCSFDEYARMHADSGVVNFDESVRAVQERIRPGGLILCTTAPHAPFGPCYEHVTEHHGKPTRQLAVIYCPAWDFYPAYWTPARIAEAKDSEAFLTDVAAKFAALQEALLPIELVEGAFRPDRPQIPYEAGCSYVATMDPATRSNAWTLVVATRKGDARTIVFAKEWMPEAGKPLSPKSVLGEIAQAVAQYRITSLVSDQWSADSLNDIAHDFGLSVIATHWTERERFEVYGKVRNALERKQLSLPRVPHLRDDLVRVQRRVTRTGTTIDLPVTSDGRHCDFGPAIALAVTRWIKDYESPVTDAKKEERAMRERVMNRNKPREAWEV